MNWIPLKDEQQIAEIKRNSDNRAQIIFKHSSRCGISGVAKSRLEKGNLPDDADFYFLDIIHFRKLSNEIAEQFNVYHESPQVLIIRNGECVYEESHMGITPQDIVAQTM